MVEDCAREREREIARVREYKQQTIIMSNHTTLHLHTLLFPYLVGPQIPSYSYPPPQDEKDRSIEMAAEDDRSSQVEAYHKALLAAAEAKRIAERDARLAAEKAQRAYDRDLAILEEFRGKVRLRKAYDVFCTVPYLRPPL